MYVHVSITMAGLQLQQKRCNVGENKITSSTAYPLELKKFLGTALANLLSITKKIILTYKILVSLGI